MSTRVGLLQLQVDSADGVDQRIDRAMSLVEKILAGANVELPVVAAEGTDLSASVEFLVLPELWTVGALDSEAMLAAPLSIDGSVVKAFAELAAKYSVWLHLGSIPEVDGDQRFNTSIVFGPDGVIAATYRKIHLFGFDSGEAAMLTSGTQIVCVPRQVCPPVMTFAFQNCIGSNLMLVLRVLSSRPAGRWHALNTGEPCSNLARLKTWHGRWGVTKSEPKPELCWAGHPRWSTLGERCLLRLPRTKSV